MPPDEKDMGPLTPAESVQLQRGMEMGQTGMAYAVLQATKPATVGLALSSSPLAILAWSVNQPLISLREQNEELTVEDSNSKDWRKDAGMGRFKGSYPA